MQPLACLMRQPIPALCNAQWHTCPRKQTFGDKALRPFAPRRYELLSTKGAFYTSLWQRHRSANRAIAVLRAKGPNYVAWQHGEGIGRAVGPYYGLGELAVLGRWPRLV